MNILELMDKHCSDVTIDNAFVEKVKEYVIGYGINNSEYFSTPYIGITHIRYLPSDVSYFFNYILGVNKAQIEKDMVLVDAIVIGRKITGDVFNITLFYFVHRTIHSKLPKATKHVLAEMFVKMFCYRTVSALNNNGFSKFLAKPEDAHATYEALSDMFILKKLRSWDAYIDFRVESVLGEKSIHIDTLIHMADDKKFLYVISDTQGRLASTFKRVYATYVNVVEERSATVTDGQVTTEFGEEVVRGVMTGTIQVVNGTISKLSVPSAWVDISIIDTVQKMTPSSSPRALRSLIESVADTKMTPTAKKRMEDFVRNTLTWIYAYISKSNLTDDEKSDIGKVLPLVRGAISASRINDGELNKIIADGNKIVVDSIQRTGRQRVGAYRVALILYIFIFSLLRVKK